jgi:hypothetical protein
MALQAAVEQMNGAEVNGARIEVEPAHGTPSTSDAVDKGSARLCSIFVKGFGPEVGFITFNGVVLLLIFLSIRVAHNQ